MSATILYLPMSLEEPLTQLVDESWDCGSPVKGTELKTGTNTVIALIPGGALLVEAITLPQAPRNKRELKQWLLANPDLCLWQPNKEHLLKLVIIDKYCVYWAVDVELWHHWQKLLLKYKYLSAWAVPDWALLPSPIDERPYAARLCGHFLYRQQLYEGGSLLLTDVAILEQAKARWLSFAGTEQKGIHLPLQSASRLFKQPELKVSMGMAANFKRAVGWLTKALLFLFVAVTLEQGAEVAWLGMTRSAPRIDRLQPTRKELSAHLLLAGRQLMKLEQKTPLLLKRLHLMDRQLELDVVAVSDCAQLEKQAQSQQLSLSVTGAQKTAPCHATLKGEL